MIDLAWLCGFNVWLTEGNKKWLDAYQRAQSAERNKRRSKKATLRQWITFPEDDVSELDLELLNLLEVHEWSVGTSGVAPQEGSTTDAKADPEGILKDSAYAADLDESWVSHDNSCTQ